MKEQHLAQILSDFEAFIKEQKPHIPSFHPHFENAFWEMILNGGKRFRPALCLSIVNALNPQMLKNAYLPALSLECLHSYSLIHDDLPCMDNAPLRRGHATLHTKYDETLATLVGDGLNTYSFYLLSIAVLDSSIKLKLIEALAHNGGIGGMVLGQVLDCAFEGKRLSLEKLEFIHTHKTAKLIATSLQFGAIIANANATFIADIYHFGLKLGLYFQLRDDIIDVCLDTAKAGKTTQNDANKNSYVNLLGLEQSKLEFKTQREALQNMLKGFNSSVESALNDLLKDYFEDIK